jgi:hypothetical protein
VIEPLTLRPGEIREVRILWHLTTGAGPLPLGNYVVQAGLALSDRPGLQNRSVPKQLQIVVFGN